MGVPKFYRWLATRYPRINQLVDENNLNIDLEIDHLYFDMNGVLHLCTHANSDEHDAALIAPTDEEILLNLEQYLDRVILKIIRPKKSIYFAVDGVAPRAKLNQQRARRFCSGRARIELLKNLHESVNKSKVFDTNCITPGTEFMVRVDHLIRKYIEKKIINDPAWKDLEIFYSDHLVPGEGEHKIMQHIRQRRNSPNHRPNQRHCLVGQDADLIMLGLATHEPHFTILREVITFSKPKSREASSQTIDKSDPSFIVDEEVEAEIDIPKSYSMCDKPFQLLHLSVLREYIELEFSRYPRGSSHDRERLIDDFIFLTFLVGNDFVPHLPSLDIGENAFETIFSAYDFLNQGIEPKEYIIDEGKIANPDMLQRLFLAIGTQEEILMKKRDMLLRSNYVSSRSPSLQDTEQTYVIPLNEEPIPFKSSNDLSSANIGDNLLGFDSTTSEELESPKTDEAISISEDGFVDESVIKSIQTSPLLIDTGRIGPNFPGISPTGEKVFGTIQHGEQISYRDHHYRYKFGIVPSDPSSQRFLDEIATEYLRGLQWCLAYYTSGCVSWGWFYPYHYAPLLSDVNRISEILPSITFDLGNPFTPFQQLLGCLPPSSSYLLPQPYQWLMNDPLSPLHHLYPMDFVEDMDGKRNPWEAVTILPFIDAKLVREAEKLHVPVSALTESELHRNVFSQNICYRLNTDSQLLIRQLKFSTSPLSPFKSQLTAGTLIPFFGFPTLRSLRITHATCKVLPTSSNRYYRYRTMILHIWKGRTITKYHPEEMISRSVFIHYPLMQEAKVVGISTERSEFRHCDYVDHKTLHGLQATQGSNALESNPEIIEFQRSSEEISQWLKISQRIRKKHLLGMIGLSGLEFGDIQLRVIVVPVIKRIKNLVTGDVEKIYGDVSFDIPVQLIRWMHPVQSHVEKKVRSAKSSQIQWRAFSTFSGSIINKVQLIGQMKSIAPTHTMTSLSIRLKWLFRSLRR